VHKQPLCRTCGISLFRTVQVATLWQGWWSVTSFFFLAWFTLISNLVARRKLLRLPEPVQPSRQTPQVRPVHHHPLAYIAILPIAWAINLVLEIATSS